MNVERNKQTNNKQTNKQNKKQTKIYIVRTDRHKHMSDNAVKYYVGLTEICVFYQSTRRPTVNFVNDQCRNQETHLD